MVLPASPTISSLQLHPAVPSPHTIGSPRLEVDTAPRFVQLSPVTPLHSQRPPATQTESPFLAPSIPQVRSAPQLLAAFHRQSRPPGRTTSLHQTKCVSKIKPSFPVFLILE